jgi:hypothetical protein
MKRSTAIIVLFLIVVGVLVWIDVTERGSEKIFSWEDLQIRVLEAEAKGGITKIIEPNGDLSVFSDGAKREELSRIEEKQKTLMCQVDYFYHRIKRFIKKKISR